VSTEHSLGGSSPAVRGASPAAHGTSRGRPRGRGLAGGNHGAGGSLSQPPLELRHMDGSEDEDMILPRASKVFHSIAYGK
jgi:hypothetical protein